MAATSARPDALDEAVTSNAPILSWESLFQRLLHPPAHPTATFRDSLQKELLSPYSLRCLSSPQDPFAKPSTASLSELNTKTAAIHTTGASQAGGLPASKLKELALSLSRELVLDELVALRIVILDYQQLFFQQPKVGTIDALFDDQQANTEEYDNAFKRLVGLVFSERRFIILSATLLGYLSRLPASPTISCKTSWLEHRGLAQTVFKSVTAHKSDVRIGYIEDIFSKIQETLSTEKRPAWVIARDGQNFVPSEVTGAEWVVFWEKQQLQETVLLLELVMSLTGAASPLLAVTGDASGMNGIMNASVLMHWCQLLESTQWLSRDDCFLTPPALLSALWPPVQALTSLLFLSHLSVPEARHYLSTIQRQESDADEDMTDQKPASRTFSDKDPYLASPGALKAIQNTLIVAAEARFTHSNLPMLGWSLISIEIKNTIAASKGELEDDSEVTMSSEEGTIDDVDGEGADQLIRAVSPQLRYLGDVLSPVMEELRMVQVGGRYEDAGIFLAQHALKMGTLPTVEKIMSLLASSLSYPSVLLSDMTSSYPVLAEGAWGEISAGQINSVLGGLTASLVQSNIMQYNTNLLKAVVAVWETSGTLLVEARNSATWKESTLGALLANSSEAVLRMFWSVESSVLINLFGPSNRRFPYETMPFVYLLASSLASTTASLDDNSPPNSPTSASTALPYIVGPERIHEHVYQHVVDYLSSSQSFTAVFLKSRYNYDIDPTNDDLLVLQQAMVVFPGRYDDSAMNSSISSSRQVTVYGRNDVDTIEASGGFVLPSGTMGRFVTVDEVEPPVVMWRFEFSSFGLLGRMLESAVNGTLAEDVKLLGMQDYAEDEIIRAVVGFYGHLISGGGYGDEHSRLEQALEHSGDRLEENRDVISLILELFEESLLGFMSDASVSMKSTRKSNPSQSTSVRYTSLRQFFRFTRTLLSVFPNRVWPFLSRSSMLERDSRALRGGASTGSALTAILNGFEVVKGEFSLTCEAANFFRELVLEAVASSVSGWNVGSNGALQSASKKRSHRQRASGIAMGVSKSVMKEIILSFTHYFASVLESYRGWSWESVLQRSKLGQTIAEVFTSILTHVYGFDGRASPDAKITAVLGPSAEHIVRVFIAETVSSLPLAPLVATISDASTITTRRAEELGLSVRAIEEMASSTAEILKFAATSVRVRVLLGLTPSKLEHLLNDSAAAIASLTQSHVKLRQPALDLLAIIVEAAGATADEPPSLLGHLGPGAGRDLARSLAYLDKPLDDVALEIQTWDLISTILSQRQQGMAILLITGENYSRASAKPEDKAKVAPLLDLALEMLVDIDNMDSALAVAMLKAVSMAQNYWSLLAQRSEKWDPFIDAMQKYIITLNSVDFRFENADAATVVVVEKCNKIACAAAIAQIFAMDLHRRRRLNKADVSRYGKLEFFYAKGVNITGYRASLHANLRRNFQDRWPSLQLQSLEKTRVQPKVYGEDYIYDVQLATRILDFDPAWNKKTGGYIAELKQANLNLSIIDCQRSLVRPWSLLATEICEVVKGQPAHVPKFTDVVKKCLEANVADAGTPTPFLGELWDLRLDFSFAIMQRLVEGQAIGGRLDDVLEVSWRCVDANKELLMKELGRGDIGLFRPVLRIIYLILSTMLGRTEYSPRLLQALHDIFDLLVVRGFAVLSNTAIQNPHLPLQGDMMLIIAILQGIRRLPQLTSLYSKFQGLVADNGVVRAVATLFSWSDKLAQDGDPVYGEAALLYLLEMSYIDLLAEQLAIDGVFARLAEGAVSLRIQRGGISPTDNSRLHSIWAKGMLPLTLNICHGIGLRIGKEVAGFMSSFRPQITTCISSISTPKSVTMPLVNELTHLVTIVAVLDQFGEKELNSALGDRRAVVDAVDYLLTHRNYLQTLIAPTTPKEAELLARESDDFGSALEQRIVEALDVVQQLLGDVDEAM